MKKTGVTGEGLLTVLLVALAMAMVAIAAYSAPRGFDLLDSGCYYLEYAYPLDSSDTHTSYRFFAAPLFDAVGGNLVAFRWLSWVLLWSSVFVFLWGWRRFLPWREGVAGKTRWMGYAAIYLLANSAAYTIKPAALTYNSLNVIAVNLVVGFLLAALDGVTSTQKQRNRQAYLWFGLSVAVAAVQFFIKPTTSAFLLFVVFALPLLSPSVPKPWKLRLLGVCLTALLLGLAIMFVFLGGFAGLKVRFETLVGILQNSSYMDILLRRTWREFDELATFLASDLRWPGLALLGGAGAALLAAWRTPRLLPALGITVGAVILSLWIFRVVDEGLWRGSHQLYMHGVVARTYLSLLALAVGCLLVSRLILRKVPSTQASLPPLAADPVTATLFFLVLLLTPFAGAFGSTTTVYLNGALYAGCWTGALVLVLNRLARRWGTPTLLWVPLLPLAVVSVAQLFHGQVAMPYMQNKPLWEQRTPVRFGEAESVLLVDQETADYIERVRRVLLENGFKKGDDIFCFFNVPGLVFAVGGKSPVIPWYFGRIYSDDPVEEHYMRKAGPERIARAWLITQDDVTRFSPHFHKGGVPFPEGYQNLDSFLSPFTALKIGIWRPRVSNVK